jgi:hypothetical protein
MEPIRDGATIRGKLGVNQPAAAQPPRALVAQSWRIFSARIFESLRLSPSRREMNPLGANQGRENAPFQGWWASNVGIRPAKNPHNCKKVLDFIGGSHLPRSR